MVAASMIDASLQYQRTKLSEYSPGSIFIVIHIKELLELMLDILERYSELRHVFFRTIPSVHYMNIRVLKKF